MIVLPQHLHFEKDILGIGESTAAAIKLLDTYSRAIGRGLAIPIGYVEGVVDAKTEAAAKKIRTNAEIEDSKLRQRALARLQTQEIRKQKNIETILASAYSKIPKDISSEPVDEDWATRFFTIAADVSEKSMQEIWSRILAGEVSEPGTYSLRTLSIVQNLKKEEAVVFVRVASLVSIIVAENDSRLGILKASNQDESPLAFGITYDDLIMMRDAGLLMNGDELKWKFSKGVYEIIYGSKKLRVVLDAEDTGVKCLMFTLPGRELLKLVLPQTQFNSGYYSWLKNHMIEKGGMVSEV